MAESTNISWCQHTHNHWIGCMRLSPACDGCYAANMMETRFGRVSWGGPGQGTGTRVLTSKANRRKPIGWNRKAAAAGTRPFVFCSSLADVFDKHVDPRWRADLFDLIRNTPNLVWLLLTKRPQLIVKLSDEAGGLPPNVALGTTVEDQERADANLAALHVARIELSPLFVFGSFEPILELVVVPDRLLPDLVITGGETDQGDHKARPFHPDWPRRLRDQCRRTGRVYHHKQNGEWLHESQTDADGMEWWPARFEGETHRWDDGSVSMRVRKRHSGHYLDGVAHLAMPTVERIQP